MFQKSLGDITKLIFLLARDLVQDGFQGRTSPFLLWISQDSLSILVPKMVVLIRLGWRRRGSGGSQEETFHLFHGASRQISKMIFFLAGISTDNGLGNIPHLVFFLARQGLNFLRQALAQFVGHRLKDLRSTDTDLQ